MHTTVNMQLISKSGSNIALVKTTALLFKLKISKYLKLAEYKINEVKILKTCFKKCSEKIGVTF